MFIESPVYGDALYITHHMTPDWVEVWGVTNVYDDCGIAAFTAEHVAVNFTRKLIREIDGLKEWLEFVSQHEYDEILEHPITQRVLVLRQHETFIDIKKLYQD